MPTPKPNDARRARWNAAKRAALPADICPTCMARPKATKRLKTTGKLKRLSQCGVCTARLRGYARAQRS